MNNSEFMSIKELCKYINMSEKFVYKHLLDGKIPAVRMGRTWRIRKSEIEKRLLGAQFLLD